MEKTKRQAKVIYDVCVEHLIEEGAKQGIHINPRLINKYLQGHGIKVESLEDVFQHLVFSLQNYSMMPNVINIESRKTQFLLGYNPRKVFNAYGNSVTKLKKAIKAYNPSINLEGKLWTRYCQGIIDSARWMTQFRNLTSFKMYLKPYQNAGIEGIFILISSIADGRIKGIKQAIAFDFIKELGLDISRNCAKPDTHIIKTMVGLGICKKNATEKEVVIAVSKIAEKLNISTFAMDRLLWLANSGKFYMDSFDRLWSTRQTTQHRRILIREIKKRWKLLN